MSAIKQQANRELELTVLAISSDIFMDIAQSGHDLVELTQASGIGHLEITAAVDEGLLIEMIPAMKRRGTCAAILRPGAGRTKYYREAGHIAALTGDARQRGHAIRIIKETMSLGAGLGTRAVILECGPTGVDSSVDRLALRSELLARVEDGLSQLIEPAASTGIRVGLATGAGIHEFPDRQDLQALFGTFEDTLGYWHDWSKASIGEQCGFGDHGSWLKAFHDRTIGATLNTAGADPALVSELLPEKTFKVIGPGLASTTPQVRSMVNMMLRAGVA